MFRFLLLLVLALTPTVAKGDISTGLELWLRLDENTGSTANDSSGHNRHQTISGNPSWVSGRIGSSLAFDGVGDYISTASEDLGDTDLFADTGKPFSVACWANITTTGGTLISRASATNNQRTFQLFVTATERPAVILRGTQNGYSVLTLADVWHHYVVTCTGTSAKFYFDGTEVTSPSVPAIGSASEESGQHICFGARSNGAGNNLTGKLDEIRVYSRAMSAGDVTELYQYSGLNVAAAARYYFQYQH